MRLLTVERVQHHYRMCSVTTECVLIPESNGSTCMIEINDSGTRAAAAIPSLKVPPGPSWKIGMCTTYSFIYSMRICLCIRLYAYVYAYMPMYTRTCAPPTVLYIVHAYMYMQIRRSICVYAYVYAYMPMCTRTCLCIRVYLCMRVYADVYTYMPMYMPVYMPMYISLLL